MVQLIKKEHKQLEKYFFIYNAVMTNYFDAIEFLMGMPFLSYNALK